MAKRIQKLAMVVRSIPKRADAYRRLYRQAFADLRIVVLEFGLTEPEGYQEAIQIELAKIAAYQQGIDRYQQKAGAAAAQYPAKLESHPVRMDHFVARVDLPKLAAPEIALVLIEKQGCPPEILESGTPEFQEWQRRVAPQ